MPDTASAERGLLALSRLALSLVEGSKDSG